MALKADRQENYTDVSFFMNTTAERGLIVVHVTGSGATTSQGAAMDDALALVVVPSVTVSGTRPAGLLLNDVVDLDLTRQHLNYNRDEVQKGGKVTLLRAGQVVTNKYVTGALTPPIGPGMKAYYNSAGLLTTVAVADTGVIGQTHAPSVGRFLSAVDSDGYVKVDINIT